MIQNIYLSAYKTVYLVCLMKHLYLILNLRDLSKSIINTFYFTEKSVNAITS
jgi:hypothetical protein